MERCGGVQVVPSNKAEQAKLSKILSLDDPLAQLIKLGRTSAAKLEELGETLVGQELPLDMRKCVSHPDIDHPSWPSSTAFICKTDT
jgi:hypothetical protein